MKKQDSRIHVELGARLRHHRTRLGITIEQLAERLDVTPRYFQDVERGKVGMSLTTLRNVCGILSVSADALLFDAPAGIDALLRDCDRAAIEHIEELVRLQLRIMQK